jgi:hypothetical protein
MFSERHPSDVDYIRLFFCEEQEDMAVLLATLLLEHLNDNDHFIRPDDPVEELLGWETKPTREIVSFLIAMEEQEVFPKEALNRVETFRDLVEYVVARSRPVAERASHRSHQPRTHNSFTNL